MYECNAVKTVTFYSVACLSRITYTYYYTFMELGWAFIKSRKQGTAEAAMDPWRSSGSTPLVKEGHLEQVAPDHVQRALVYLWG